MFTAKLKNKKKNKRFFFQKNGAAILEQTATSFNGNCNLIRNYSIKELKKATNNFAGDGMIYRGVDFMVYKAVHGDHKLLVKKFYNQPLKLRSSLSDLSAIANEVAIASQMSKHKNVLKLLGCCLETELPILVYEFPENGNLRDYCCTSGERRTVLPWETKLRIAMDIANAVAYLHHGFSKTFIYRDLCPAKIFLGQDYVAKLSDFRISIPIPEGKTHVDADIMGSHGFIAPEVVRKGRLTERSDVYDFGILFCMILTQKSSGLMMMEKLGHNNDKKNKSSNSMEEELIESSDMNSDRSCFWTDVLMSNVMQEGNEKQVMECSKLIERCLSENNEDRPDMIEVAKAVRFIINIKQ